MEKWSIKDHLFRISWHLFCECAKLCGQIWLSFILASESKTSILFHCFLWVGDLVWSPAATFKISSDLYVAPFRPRNVHYLRLVAYSGALLPGSRTWFLRRYGVFPVMHTCSIADVESLVSWALYRQVIVKMEAAIILVFISLFLQWNFTVLSHRPWKPLVVLQRSMKTCKKHVKNYFW